MLNTMVRKKVSERATKEDIEFARQMGERIRYLRKRKKPKMTIEKLAEDSKLSSVTVGGAERGEIPLLPYSTIKKIAKALGVPPTVLTGETDLVKIIEIADNLTKYPSN